jgi:hypothetical protein
MRRRIIQMLVGANRRAGQALRRGRTPNVNGAARHVMTASRRAMTFLSRMMSDVASPRLD